MYCLFLKKLKAPSYSWFMFYLQIENLKKTTLEDDKKRQEDIKQAEVFESHSKFMKSKVSRHFFGKEIGLYGGGGGLCVQLLCSLSPCVLF